MSVNFQSNKRAFLADLVGLARQYGWQGDYTEVSTFVKWAHEELEEKVNDLELEPFSDDHLTWE